MKHLFFLLLSIHCLSPLFAQEYYYLPYHKGTKWGVYDLSEAKLMIECKYDSIGKIHTFNKYDSLLDEGVNYGYFEFQRNKLWGIANLNGQEIIEPKYDSVEVVQNKQEDIAFLLQKKKKWGANDINGKEIVPCKYESVFFDDILRIKQNGKWGAIDHKQPNKQLIACKYDYIYGSKMTHFWENSDYYDEIDTVYWKVKNKGKFGVVKADGKEFLPCIFEDVKLMGENHFFVRQNKKWKLVDAELKPLMKEEYSQVFPNGDAELGGRMEDILEMERERKYQEYLAENPEKEEEIEEKREVNKEAQEIYNKKIEEKYARYEAIFAALSDKDSSNKYDEIRRLYSETLFKVSKNDKWAFFVPNDSILTAFEYDYISIAANSNFIEVFKGMKFGYLNLSGEVVYECEYEENPDQFTCRKNGKWGVLGTVPFIYDSIYPAFGNDFSILIVSKMGKLGVYYGNGIQALKCEYDSLCPYSVMPNGENSFWVKQNGKWGLLNDKEEIILPFEYERVKFKGITYTIPFVENEYTHTNLFIENKSFGTNPFLRIEYVYTNLLYVFPCKNGKWGAIDKVSKETLLAFEYQNIAHLASDAHILVQKDNLWGIYDLKLKKWILPCEYDAFECLGQIEETYLAGAKGDIAVVRVSERRNRKISEAFAFKIKKNGKWGVLIVGNDTISTTPCLYSAIEPMNDFYEHDFMFFWVRRGDKWGLMSENGKEYFE